MGAVEAISLSILVGSSVDYCVHLVEGYLLAGENLPPHQAEVSTLPALPPQEIFPCLCAAEGPPVPDSTQAASWGLRFPWPSPPQGLKRQGS